MQPPIYDPNAVKPFRQELEYCGVTSLMTPDDVDASLSKPGTTLVVINSVCGCAAGNARPGVTLALQNAKIPDQLGTVFAGMERDAVDRARGHMPQIAPSSPCIALFKDGQPVFVLERRHIERMTREMVAQALTENFDQHCNRQGPSIPPDKFAELQNAQMCGNSIPLFRGN